MPLDGERIPGGVLGVVVAVSDSACHEGRVRSVAESSELDSSSLTVERGCAYSEGTDDVAVVAKDTRVLRRRDGAGWGSVARKDGPSRESSL